MPPVVFVTTASASSSGGTGFPIMGPPVTTKYSLLFAPPASSMHFVKGVPTGTCSTEGSFTSPVTVRNFFVNGMPCMASPTAYSVATLSTTAPTAAGMPAGGTTLPVTS